MYSFLFSQTPLSYFAASFWRDEAFSFLMAKQPILRLLLLTAQDSNPPLYYVILKIWMFLFGSSEVALRSFSLLCFWATLFVIYLILTECFSVAWKKACLYLLLFLCNPLLQYYAFEARMYSLMGLLGALSFYTLFRKNYSLYATVMLVSLFTHYFLFFLFGIQILTTILTHHARERNLVLKAVRKKIIWFIPWFIVLVFAHPPMGKEFWIGKSTLSELILLPSYLFTGYEQLSGIIYKKLYLISYTLFCIILFGIYTLMINVKKNRRYGVCYEFVRILFLCGICIPFFIFLISFYKPIFLPRYLIFSSVSLLLFIVITVDSMHIHLKYIVFAALLIISIHYAGVQVTQRTKTPLKKTFYSIQSEIRSDDLVYVTHEYNFHPALYYLRNITDKIYIYNKTYEELPWYVGKVLIPKDHITSNLPYYPQRAFVVQEDGTYSIQSHR